MQLVRAKTVAEALACLSAGPARLLAGGTDLGVEYRRHLPDWERLIHIGRIPELRSIKVGETEVEIGAAVTHAQIAAEAYSDPGFAVIRDASKTVGSPGIMNFGTIGGNLATASPAGDVSLALLALGAQIVIVGMSGERVIGIDDFFLGPRRSVLRSGEIISSVRFRRRDGAYCAGAFCKFGNRAGSVLSLASAAVVVEVDDQNICHDVRVAFGSVAPVPKRGFEVEGRLVGSALTDVNLSEAVNLDISPIDDQRSSAWYRREAAVVLLQDAIGAAKARLELGHV